MFWKFLIVVALAIGLMQLGALSVWVTVLKAVLLGVLAVVLGMGLLFLWRHFKRT
jgi:hypothetical protein